MSNESNHNDTQRDPEQISGVSSSQEEAGAALHKIQAIKSALHQQENERQQEETRAEIAGKIRQMKSAKEYHEQQETIAKTARSSSPKKKKKKKKRKSFGKRLLSIFPQKGDSFFEILRKLVFLGSSVVFIVCICMIVNYFWDNYQNAQLNGDLREKYNASAQLDTGEIAIIEETDEKGEVYEFYGLLSSARTMLEINPDVVGWINIPDTEINYPVLQNKESEEGNDYYLKRNIYGNSARAGSIFLDYRNYFDYVIDGRKQYENSQNLVIYGHNMQDYSMFGGLKYYINDATYYDAHPIVELNSNYRRYQYKIFGMIIVDIDDETDTKFDYWNVLNFADEWAFYDYVNEVKRRTIRLTDVDVTYGDQLLTLSTCNSTFTEGRLVVFARLLREGEDLYEGTTSIANPNVKWPNSYYRWHNYTYDPDAEFVPYG